MARIRPSSFRFDAHTKALLQAISEAERRGSMASAARAAVEEYAVRRGIVVEEKE